MPEKSGFIRRLDEIERRVFLEYLKPRGFRKHGRALNRVVDGDMVQIVQFQGGNTIRQDNDRFRVLFSLRVPECTEQTVTPKPLKTGGYRECDANFRMKELGELENRRPAENFEYPLYEGCEDAYVHKIADVLERIVLPVLDALDTRGKFLTNRVQYRDLEWLCNADLDAALILARMGREEEASACFQRYYDLGVEEDLQLVCKGTMVREIQLARRYHLEELAEKNGIPLQKKER